MIDRTHRAHRYVAWVDRHGRAIVASHLLVFALSIWLVATRLPILADFVYLLPQDAPAVRDMHALEARIVANDTVLVVVQSTTPEACASAAREMAAGARALRSELVVRVDEDDAEARAFLDAHRHLLVPLPELEQIRDALKRRIDAAKLEANPLYVDLDDTAATEAASRRELDELRSKRREVESRLHRPSNLSPDGRTALVQVQTPLRATDIDRGRELLDALERVRAGVVAHRPGVEIGFAGDLVTTLSEQRAIVNGTVWSSIVTVVLVGLVLALYFRSATLLALLIGTLAIATTAAFGAAALTIGHLNAATAFLGAIIAGNGVNYGILLVARYVEERRGHEQNDALARAIEGTLRPTLVASLGAAIAYGSLAATSFRGFADFALIGAVGMIVCWIATFALLPVLVLRLGTRARIRTDDPAIGIVLVRLFGFRRSTVVLATAGLAAVVAAVVVVRYLAADPFEYDMRQLGSSGADAVTERYWMTVSQQVGRDFAGHTFIAVDRPEQVPLIVDALRRRDPAGTVIGSVDSILDLIPEHPRERVAVLDEIRRLLDDDALAALDPPERDELARLRPPDGLVAFTAQSLPPSITRKLVEADGRIGNLIAIRPAATIDELDGHDVMRFAAAVSRIELANGDTVTTSGASVIFANILEAIERDGPIVTALAAVGLVVMVIVVVGRNRNAAAILLATGAGGLFMIAACALLGLSVNFLDFIALPITLGLGIDYAINIAHRHEAADDSIATLRTSGGAVFVCSLTTMIGYGSLLVSENLAIRGFGTAALVGEITSVLAALIIVPAFLAAKRSRRAYLGT